MPACSARRDLVAGEAEHHCDALAALGWNDGFEQRSGASVAGCRRVGGVGGLLSCEKAVRAARAGVGVGRGSAGQQQAEREECLPVRCHILDCAFGACLSGCGWEGG